MVFWALVRKYIILRIASLGYFFVRIAHMCSRANGNTRLTFFFNMVKYKEKKNQSIAFSIVMQDHTVGLQWLKKKRQKAKASHQTHKHNASNNWRSSYSNPWSQTSSLPWVRSVSCWATHSLLQKLSLSLIQAMTSSRIVNCSPWWFLSSHCNDQMTSNHLEKFLTTYKMHCI